MPGRRRHSPGDLARGERLGAAIAAARQARGRTQEEVARLAEVALSTLRKIETGQTCDPSFFTVVEVARAVDERLDALAKAAGSPETEDNERSERSPP